MGPFTQPYGIEPKSGDRPLLTVLLEGRDAVHPTDVDVLARTPDDAVGHLVVRVTDTGRLDSHVVPLTGDFADPLPGGLRLRGAPAVLNTTDLSLVSVYAIDETGQAVQTRKSREAPTAQWRGRWTAWTPLPRSVELSAGLAAIESPESDLVRVFALGVDGRIHQTVYVRGSGGGWRPWSALPGSVTLVSAPAVLNSPDGKLVSVFALGVDGRIHQAVYAKGSGGGWRPWSALPGSVTLASAPAVLNSPDGKLVSVFALGVDGRIHQTVYVRSSVGGWRPWSALPGSVTLASAPAVLNSPDGNRVLVMALGDDGQLHCAVYLRNQSGAPWTPWVGWSPLPGGERFSSAPALAPWLLYRRSREAVRDMLFGEDHTVQGYFSEVSYGRFTFVEAETTPWLVSQDDPSTAVDESLMSFILAGGYVVERQKGAWVLRQADGAIPGGLARFAGRDGRLTSEDLSALWLYTGGGGGGALRELPEFTVPNLGTPVCLAEGLARCGVNSSVGLVAHEIAHEHLGVLDLYTAMRIRRMAVSAKNDHVFTWFDDGTLCEGTSRHLDRYAPRQTCTYPPGRTAADLVGVGIAQDGHAYAWYRNGTTSAGTPSDLASYRAPQDFEPAPGRRADGDIVDVEIARNDYVFAWYRDGTVSIGTSRDLASRDIARPYTAVGTYGPGDIVGLGIAGSNDYVYAWYKDGTVSAGTAHDLDFYRDRSPFRVPPEAYPGPGRLSLMDDGGSGAHVSHLDPWTKMKLGWLSPTVVSRTGVERIPGVETHPVAFILHDPSRGQAEYFIVENRHPGSSYESDLTGGGLAVWHIHERGPFSGHKDFWSRKTIHLVKPLGLDLRNEFDDDRPPTPAADYVWDGSDPRRSYDLCADSVPTSTRWDDGSDSGIRISDISRSGATMTVRFEVP